MNNNQLGIYLQSLRKQNNYTQALVAEKIGVIRQTYSHYETGRVRPSVEVLCRLADFYGIPIETLVGAANILQLEESQSNENLYQLSQKEQELIRYHRLLDESEQDDIITFATMLAQKRQNEDRKK